MATVISATFAGLGAVIGAWALLVRARGESAKPSQLLRRLVDTLQAKGLWERVPTMLRTEIEAHLMDDDK